MTGFLGSFGDLAETAIARIGGPAMAPQLERRRVHDDGAQKLRLAILQGAVSDYRYARYRDGALAWINSESDCWPFDFATIAISFGYDPNWMRRRVLRLLRCIDEGTERHHKRSPAGIASPTSKGHCGRSR
jgi:hypothetical protein